MKGFAAEKAYVRSIEKRFLALRESGLFVSPRDFALLLDWHDRGIPADLVIATIQELFSRARGSPGSKEILSIAYCRRAVESAWRERRAALLGPRGPCGGESAGRAVFTLEEVAAHLEESARALRAAAARLPAGARTSAAGIEAIAARLVELRETIRSAPPATFENLEGELARLETKTIDCARAALQGAERETLERESTDRIAPFSSRMSARAREATLRRAMHGAIRERFGIPRLSLLGLSRRAEPV